MVALQIRGRLRPCSTCCAQENGWRKKGSALFVVCARPRSRKSTQTCQCRGSEARAIPRSICFLQSYEIIASTQSAEPYHGEILSIMDELRAHLQPACRANIIGLYGYSSALISRQAAALSCCPEIRHLAPYHSNVQYRTSQSPHISPPAFRIFAAFPPFSPTEHRAVMPSATTQNALQAFQHKKESKSVGRLALSQCQPPCPWQ